MEAVRLYTIGLYSVAAALTLVLLLRYRRQRACQASQHPSSFLSPHLRHGLEKSNLQNQYGQPATSRTSFAARPPGNPLRRRPAAAAVTTDTQRFRQGLHSGNLASALSLPRPTLQVEAGHAQQAQHEPQEHEAPPDTVRLSNNSAVSSSGYVETNIDPVSSRAVRETNVFSRHPEYRRRVRTWDVGRIEPVPARNEEEHLNDPQLLSAEHRALGHDSIGRTGTW